MDTHICYQFPIQRASKKMARAWRWQEGTDDLLAIAYVSNLLEVEPFSCTLSFLLFDIKAGYCLQTSISRDSLPGIEELYLAYDTATATWIIGDKEYETDSYSDHLVLRQVSCSKEGVKGISDPFFDDPANDMATTGPILSLSVANNFCTLLYQKPTLDYVGTPSVFLLGIDIPAKQIKESIEWAEESSLVCHCESGFLLLALAPRPKEGSPREGYNLPGDWSFILSSYDMQSNTFQWHNYLSPSFPFGSGPVLRQRINDFEWLGINATVIPGPPLLGTRQPTFLVGATMMDVFHLKGSGHTSIDASLLPRKADTLIHIDGSGNVLRTCQDSIGLRIHLCRIGSLVVGLDLVAGRWRLWRWSPLQDESLQSVTLLDEHVFCAHVLVDADVEMQSTPTFWLIEETSKGLKISQRDALTFEDVVSPAILPGAHLLEPQNMVGILDWHTKVEALFYQGKLLLLALNDQEQLTLYQFG